MFVKVKLKSIWQVLLDREEMCLTATYQKGKLLQSKHKVRRERKAKQDHWKEKPVKWNKVERKWKGLWEKKPKTEQQMSSERRATVHREECYKEFRDHGIYSKLSFGRQKNVPGVLTSWLLSSRPSLKIQTK